MRDADRSEPRWWWRFWPGRRAAWGKARSDALFHRAVRVVNDDRYPTEPGRFSGTQTARPSALDRVLYGKPIVEPLRTDPVSGRAVYMPEDVELRVAGQPIGASFKPSRGGDDAA